MLNIAETHAQLGKIANNIECHGEDEVTAFDCPISGIILSQEQVNELLDEPHAVNALFNKKRSGAIEPTFRQFEPLVLKDSFDGATVRLKCGQTTFTLRDCKIKAVELEPQNGGTTVLSLKLRLRPENDKQILALLGAQHREVRIDIAEAKVAEKGDADRQGDLLDGGDGKGDDDEPAAGRGGDDAKAARAVAEAFEKGKPTKPVKKTNGASKGVH